MAASRIFLHAIPTSAAAPSVAPVSLCCSYGIGPGSCASGSGELAGCRIVQQRANGRGGRGRDGKSAASGGGVVRAQIGSTALFAKEMERVAAKEALLLAIKDAGGLQGLSDRAGEDKTRIIVNEKILGLERLNPTPRPTTSPMLDGLWEFQWAGTRSPGILAARTLLKRFPSALASLNSLTLLIVDGSAKAVGNLKVFNTIESSFTLNTKLTVEGPLKLKEEYVDGLVATPTVPEESIPSQLKGLFDQFVATIERLPESVKDVFTGGVKVPLTGTFSRELLISYLDAEILVARDKSGIPDVLLRVEAPMVEVVTPTVVPEYIS